MNCGIWSDPGLLLSRVILGIRDESMREHLVKGVGPGIGNLRGGLLARAMREVEVGTLQLPRGAKGMVEKQVLAWWVSEWLNIGDESQLEQSIGVVKLAVHYHYHQPAPRRLPPNSPVSKLLSQQAAFGNLSS